MRRTFFGIGVCESVRLALCPGASISRNFEMDLSRKADYGPLTVNTRSPAVLILRSSTLDHRCSEYRSAVYARSRARAPGATIPSSGRAMRATKRPREMYIVHIVSRHI